MSEFMSYSNIAKEGVTRGGAGQPPFKICVAPSLMPVCFAAGIALASLAISVVHRAGLSYSCEQARADQRSLGPLIDLLSCDIRP